MEKEEVELLPAGLVTCLLNNKEVRILKISPKKLTVRLSQGINKINEFKTIFYIFDKNRYKEIIIKNYKLIEKVESEFYLTYIFEVNNEEYLNNVRIAFKNYIRYVMSKSYSDDNEFSKEMVNYPSELDYDFYKNYSNQKYNWMVNLNYETWTYDIMNSLELAINIDNDILYKKYLEKDIRDFKIDYLKSNFVENHKLFKKDISRIYIGNEFCHNLFPKVKVLINMLNKSKRENLGVTVAFTYIRDCYIDKTKDIVDKLYKWCKENNKKIEIIINDWGMVNLANDKTDYFNLSLGILLNKRKKDPRYSYKNGYIENKELISKNNLNSKSFNKFLKECKIKRYEYESCGYRISIAEGKHSLHIPFYVTNTSQYCTLYAMCTTMDRGNQKLVMGCPMYCKDYIFSYPKHLKMVGRYNSLFAFDDTLLKDSEKLEHYVKNGIDRIVLNFM